MSIVNSHDMIIKKENDNTPRQATEKIIVFRKNKFENRKYER